MFVEMREVERQSLLGTFPPPQTATAARGLAALQHAIHKIKPRPDNAFHIAGAGLYKIQDMNRSFRFLKKFLRFS